jgi:hypothetical protein
MLLIYFSFKKTSQPFLVSPALSSLPASYKLMASPYLTPVVKFMACSCWHITSACSTPMFYRYSGQSILTRSSTTQRTLTFSICTTFSAHLLSLSSGNERPHSSYGRTPKRCSSQSLLTFQHSAVPKILQWMSTGIKLRPLFHPRCCFLSPKLSQNFNSHSIIFTGTSADLSTYTQCYTIYRYKQSGAMLQTC